MAVMLPVPSRRFRRPSWSAWLVALAMTLVFLAPGVSRTLAFARGEMPVGCPLHAAMAAQQPADASGTSVAKAAQALVACPLCSLAGAVPLPPSYAGVVVADRVTRVPWQPAALAAPALRPAWRAQPRAPPAQA